MMVSVSGIPVSNFPEPRFLGVGISIYVDGVKFFL